MVRAESESPLGPSALLELVGFQGAAWKWDMEDKLGPRLRQQEGAEEVAGQEWEEAGRKK